MKNVLLGLLLVIGQWAMAQSTEPMEATSKWFTNLEAAKAHAEENNQHILMVFAGSDWCRPCIQFKEDILKSDDFASRMEDKITILYLDFPAKRKNKLSAEQTAHNEALAEQYNKSGFFPNIFLLDVNEKVLANPAYKKQTALDFIQEITEVESKM